MSKPLPLTEFDIITQPDYIQLLKAILPFMEYNMQRRISTLIRTNELKNTIRFYNSPANCNIFRTCSNSSGISFNTPINEILNNEQLIKTITTYCSGNIINMINTYKSFSKMSDMFNMMEMFNNPSGCNTSGNGENSDESMTDNNTQNYTKNKFNYSHGHNDDNNYSCNNNHNSPNQQKDNSAMFKNIMNSNQKDLYNEYIRQLDALDLDFNSKDS